MGKVIILDWSIFAFRAIYASQKSDMPIEYICMQMVVSALRRIGINPEDQIILALDGRNSWRKDYVAEYKGNRKKIEQSIWDKFDRLLNQLDKGTDWNLIKIDRIEADDIMAVGARYFKDQEVIIVSYDHDLEQCWYYDNVKIYSILKKMNPGKGAYKVKPEKFNVYELQTKMLGKEASDNLISELVTELDYDTRLLLIDLINLPECIENQIIEKYDNLQVKGMDLQHVPFKPIREKLENLYNDKSKVITYEKCVKQEEKKKLKAKKKKLIKKGR